MPVQQIRGTDVLDQTVKNLDLSPDTARANLLTNGGFEIWQRGNGPFVGAYCADRWMASGGALSVSKDVANTDTPGACAAATVTAATLMFQTLSLSEGSWANLYGKTLSFSVRVRTGTANAVRLSIYDSANGLRYGSFHPGGGTYQTLTVTAPIAVGATGVVQVSVHFDIACTAYIDNAMLVVGSVPADYAPLHPADDLARCLRYYEVLGNLANDIAIQGNATAAAVNWVVPMFPKATKAVTPTVTKLGTWAVTNCGQPVLLTASSSGFTVYVASSAAGMYQAMSPGPGFSIEANP